MCYLTFLWYYSCSNLLYCIVWFPFCIWLHCDYIRTLQKCVKVSKYDVKVKASICSSIWIPSSTVLSSTTFRLKDRICPLAKLILPIVYMCTRMDKSDRIRWGSSQSEIDQQVIRRSHQHRPHTKPLSNSSTKTNNSKIKNKSRHVKASYCIVLCLDGQYSYFFACRSSRPHMYSNMRCKNTFPYSIHRRQML